MVWHICVNWHKLSGNKEDKDGVNFIYLHLNKCGLQVFLCYRKIKKVQKEKCVKTEGGFSYPIFCPVHTKHLVLMGCQVIERSLTAVTHNNTKIFLGPHGKTYIICSSLVACSCTMMITCKFVLIGCKFCVTDLLVSHSLTRLSREPETSWCSWDGAHFTAVTQPVWEVRDSSTSEPSGKERKSLKWDGCGKVKQAEAQLKWIEIAVPLVRGSHSLMCLSELPEARRRHKGE